MNSFKSLWWVGAVAVLAACNPFEDTKGGTPVVQSALATSGTTAVDAVDCAVTPRPAECPAEVEARWLIRAQSTCALDGADQVISADQFVVFAKANKLLNGATIEAAPQTCVPAGIDNTSKATQQATQDQTWVKVTPYVGATPDTAGTDTETRNWYSCYSPGSPTATEGASVVFYRTDDPRDYAPPPTPEDPDPAPVVPGDLQATRKSWFALGAGLPASITDRTTFRITGTAKDKGGVDMPIDIELRVEPNAGATAFAPTAVTGAVAVVDGEATVPAPSLAIDVTVGECTDAGATYTIEQQVVAEDESVTWVDIGQTINAGGTFTVTQDFSTAPATALKYGTAYTYRFREHITGQTTNEEFVRTSFDADGAPTQFTQALLLAPEQPTLTATSGTTVTVAWTTPVPKATSYMVQRALVTAGVPEPFIDVGPADAGTNAGPFSFTATGLDPATDYQFRLVAVNAAGRSLPGPEAPVSTP